MIALSRAQWRLLPHKARHYWVIAAWLVAFLTLTGSALALLGGGSDYRAYYIIKWAKSGKCSVTDQRPNRGGYKTLWMGNQQRVAERKAKEFITLYRCL
jgi:hypothetical protein